MHSLCLFWTLCKERKPKAFKAYELIDHATLCPFMYMLDLVRVHLGSSSFSIFDDGLVLRNSIFPIPYKCICFQLKLNRTNVCWKPNIFSIWLVLVQYFGPIWFLHTQVTSLFCPFDVQLVMPPLFKDPLISCCGALSRRGLEKKLLCAYFGLYARRES